MIYMAGLIHLATEPFAQQILFPVFVAPHPQIFVGRRANEKSFL
jgi:hypothetical protein